MAWSGPESLQAIRRTVCALGGPSATVCDRVVIVGLPRAIPGQKVDPQITRNAIHSVPTGAL